MSSTDFPTPLGHPDSPASARMKWSLTQTAFEKLLNSLAPDRDEAGAQYEIIRRKLVRFFEWRSIDSAEDYADETINRVARRIDEGQVIDNIIPYVYAVARLVRMEAIKQRERAPVALDDAPQSLRQKTPEEKEPELRALCLDQCLDSLTADNRKLIVNYYQEEQRAKIELRQELADRLQIPLNALRIRAHRIRMSLEKCITSCVEAGAGVK